MSKEGSFFSLFLSQFLSSENLNLHCRCLLPFGKGLFLYISFLLRVLRMGEYDQDIFLGMFCCWFIERLLIFLSWPCHFATIVDQSYKLYDAIFGSFMSNNISSANKSLASSYNSLLISFSCLIAPPSGLSTVLKKSEACE